jgi:hypothetical protein
LGIGPGNEYANGLFAGVGAGRSTGTPLPGSSSQILMVPSGIDGLASVFTVLREVFDLVLATSDILSSTDLWSAQHHQIRAHGDDAGKYVIAYLGLDVD